MGIDFFSFKQIVSIICNPEYWGVIGSLIILEGLLSADNALVLAVMVKHLNKHEQKKALFYGLIGAYVFRFMAIVIGVFLIKIWWVKIVGGLYLLWISIKSLLNKGSLGTVENKNKSFWETVIALQLMDIAFSIDSVIAAFGISEQIWVLFIGGALGILMMRGVATVFVNLIEKIPELEIAAFILIAIIGIKMIMSAFGIHIDEIVFFSIIIMVFICVFIINKIRNTIKHKGK